MLFRSYDADTATDDPDLHRYLKVVLNLLQAQCLEKLHVICSPTLKWGSAILEVLDSELSGCGQLRELRLTSSGDQGWRDILPNST